MTSLIAVGDNTMDVYLDRNIEYPGGNALNVAVFASRLGTRSAYLGCVGDDRYGQRLLDCLQQEDVDASRCRTLPGANGWACVDNIDGERVFLGSDPVFVVSCDSTSRIWPISRRSRWRTAASTVASKTNWRRFVTPAATCPSTSRTTGSNSIGRP